ncbi:MAG: tape measure protein, partial [Gemmatimonas sp.]
MSGTKLKTVYYEIQGQTEHLDKAVARSEKKLAAFTRDGVRIPFQADSEPFEAGLRRSRVELTATDRAVQNLTNSFKGLGLAAGAYKAAQYAKQAVDLGDKYRSLEARLDLVTDGTENLKIVQDALFKSAQDGRQQYEGVVDLYVAAARSADTLGASQEQLLQFTDGVNGALVVSNRSSTQAAGALLQLGQALGKGVVQAEEFNSIQEGAPRILQAVAAGIGETGISYSELRNRVLEGKVTSKEFFDAFLKGSADIRREAATMPETAAGAFTKLENAVLSYLGKSATIKAGSQEIVAALNVLAENLDNVARLGITVGAVFGARLLGTAGDSITQFASEIAAARRETVSTAESAVAMANANEQLAREALETATANRAVAQTELTVAQARLDDVAATQAAIAAEREFQAARLATANREFRVGMGAGDRLPDGSMIAESSKQRAAAIRELADLRVKELGVAERQIVELAAEGKARGGLAAATVVQAEATAALGVASNTASAAQQKLAATTTLTGRALSAAGSLGSKALALIGGPLGAIVLGMYALYSVVKKVQQEAFQKYEDRAAAVSRENAKFAKSLDDVSVSALKAAEAIQRASLAQAGIRVGETSAALNAVLNGPRPSLINGPKNNAAVTEYEAKLSKAKKDHAAAVDAVSLAQANLTTVTEKLTTKQTSLNAEIESASKKFNASVAAAKLELERQTALRDAFGQSEEAIAELNAALDLKTKLSAIDAEFTGKQAEELRGYALEQAAVEKVMRQQALIAEVNKKLDEEAAEAKKKLADAAKDLAEAQKKEQAARDDLIRSHRESHEANQLTLQEQRDQIKLLGLSGEAARKFADDLLYAKKFAEFFEHTDATTAAQMAREFVANARAISNASAETDNWADGLQNIVGIVQLIGATLEQSGSNFGRSITKATTGLQSVLSGARGLANAGKDSQGNKLTGAANVISYVGPVGQVVGGFITVLDAMDAFGNKSKAKAAEVRARAEAFNDAIDLYARDITERGISSFRQQINTIGDQIGKLTNEALAVNGIAPVANRRETEASVRRQIDQAKATLAKAEQTARRPDLTVGQLATAVGQTQALPKLIARLEEVAATAHEAEKALRAEQAAKIATLREDLVGRRLRTAGSDAAASAREVELQQMREIANALSEFEGSDALTAYLDELKLVHAEEKARAETLRKQAAAQRILDDEIKALGLEGKGALAATVRSLSGQFSDIATIVDDLDLSTQAGLDGLKARARSLFEQFRADGEVTDDEQKILDALWRIFDLASDVFDSLAERVQRSLAKLQDDNDILGGDARTQFGRTVNAARGFNG